MRLNLPGLIHHNPKQSPYAIFWSSHPIGVHWTWVFLLDSPEKAQRKMLFIPLLQLQLLGEKNVTLISSLSYCQYKAGFPFQLSAPALCLPGSRGSPAPLFIWRALLVLQNVSSRREHPAPPAAPLQTDMITSITCGSPRWGPNSRDPCPEDFLRMDSECSDSSEHTWATIHLQLPAGQLWPPAHRIVPRLPGKLIRKHCRCAASQKRDHCNSPVSNFLERNCSKLQSAGPKKVKPCDP